MALIDEENGLRGGEPTYNMPQNTPLINWNGPTGLMTLLQFQPKVETPILKKDSGKLPKTLKGKLRGYVNEQERIDNRIDELNNEVYSEMPKYNNDFGKYQQENGEKIKELQTLVYQRKELDEAKINVERIKEDYDKKIALMDANASSGNIIYKNGQVFINPDTNELMNYGDYMKMVGDKDQSLNEIDFFPDIVALNKKQGYGKKALYKIISDASNKYNGAKWDNEGNLRNINEIKGDPNDKVSESISFLVTSGGGTKSNDLNINRAINLVYNKKTGKYDFGGLGNMYQNLSSYEQQDLMDDYLRMAQNGKKDDGTPLDLTVDFSNKDFQAWIYDRMITMANPLRSTQTESSTGYNWLSGYNRMNKKQKEKNVHGFMGMLATNTAINSEKVYNPQTQLMETRITQPLSQLGVKGASDNSAVEITGLQLQKWSRPDFVVGFNEIIKNNIKEGNPISINSMGTDKFWFGTIENDMKKISDLGVIVFNATGDAREYIEPKMNYQGEELKKGGHSEILCRGHLDPNSPFYSGDNKVEATTITIAVPKDNFKEFTTKVHGLYSNYTKVDNGSVSGFSALAKKKGIQITKQTLNVGGIPKIYALFNIDIKLNSSNSDMFDTWKYKEQQFEKKQDQNLENMEKQSNYNYNQLNFYKNNKRK